MRPQKALGRAVGWFWCVFTGGRNVFGAYYSSWAIKHLGYLDTLWSSIFWVLVGAFFALVLNKSKFPSASTGASSKMEELAKGLTIMREEPKVLLGGIDRIINTTAQFDFPVVMPIYMAEPGVSTKDRLHKWANFLPD